MNKIKYLDFVKYTENCRSNLEGTLKNRFNRFPVNSSLNALVSEVDTLPAVHTSEDYWIDDDIDLRELANNPPFEGCKYVYGAVVYATPTAKTLSTYDFPFGSAIPSNSVVVRSDGAIFDNRDNSLTSQTLWDISKDIISQDETFSMRYVIVYGYDDNYNDINTSIMNVWGYSQIKSMLFKNIKLNLLNFNVPNNSLNAYMPNFIYFDSCRINYICSRSQVNSAIFIPRKIVLNQSIIGNILCGSSETSIENLISITFIHENIPNIVFHNQKVDYNTKPAIIDHLITSTDRYNLISDFICEVDITNSDNYLSNSNFITYYTQRTQISKLHFTGKINKTESFIWMSKIKQIILDFSKISDLNITGIVCFAKNSASSSDLTHNHYVNIIGKDSDDNKIDFSMDFSVNNYDFNLSNMISLQNIKYIFSKLKDLSGLGITKTIKVGSRVIELLPDEVASAQLKGWTVS